MSCPDVEKEKENEKKRKTRERYRAGTLRRRGRVSGKSGRYRRKEASTECTEFFVASV